MENQQQLTEFLENSKVYRKTLEDGIRELKSQTSLIQTQISSIQVSLAEEKGRDIPSRLSRIEHELESLKTSRDNLAGSISSLKWILGVGLGFVSSLLVGLIILVVQQLSNPNIPK